MYLIVGATGSLGGRVAKELLARGQQVRAVARAESPLRQSGRYTDPAELAALGAEVVEGDLRSPETIDMHLAGVEAVLMTASGTKRMPPDTVAAIDHEGAASLAMAVKRAGVGHLVYLSAKGVGPDSPPLLRPKWQAEAAIRDIGAPATFVRPGLFMQDWIGFVLGAQLQGGTRVQLIGERDPLMTFVDEGDVVKLVTELLLEGPPRGAESTRQVDFAVDAARHVDIVQRLSELSGRPLTVERLAIGQTISTLPEPIATTVTHLLTMAGSFSDDSQLTPDVSERYGIEPRRIDGFLREMFVADPV